MGANTRSGAQAGFCVIMAGGRGTRFWPLSRVTRPKQLLPLTSSHSLLRVTFDRLQPLVGSERIIVITSRALVEETARELPELPPAQIIGEPVGRNTAPCAALGIGLAARLGGRVPVALLPADHLIPDPDIFRRQLAQAFSHAMNTREAVTFGIPPTRPETGYGYLEVASSGLSPRQDIPAGGSPNGLTDSTATMPDFLSGVRFVEKPDLATAERYLADGNFYWNGGIFVWDSQTFDLAMREHLPEVAAAIYKALATYGGPDFPAALEAAYASCPAVSLDFGVMEHLISFTVIRAAFRWSDLGSWDVWGSQAAHLGGGNRGVTHLCCVDSQENVVYAPPKTVALVGVENLIVVDTPDALLVCHADAAQRIREVTEWLREQGREDLL